MEFKNIELIGSHTSPFVRGLRIFMHNKIPYQFKVIDYLKTEDAEYLKKINPINKIPILIVDQKPILDSRKIYEILNHQYKIDQLYHMLALDIVFHNKYCGTHIYILYTTHYSQSHVDLTQIKDTPFQLAENPFFFLFYMEYSII